MADTKLDQSLDEIVSTQRKSATGRGGRGGRAKSTRNVTTRGNGNVGNAGPAGGIRKNTMGRGAGRAGAANVPTGPAARGGAGAAAAVGSRIQVSNLPKDVTEIMIKDYFAKSVGPLKRVEISYGPGGVSRGTATVSFRNADGPQRAVEQLNGILVDGKPLKIDIIVDARSAGNLTTKTLGDRMSGNPKNQPKAVINNTKKTETTKNARGGKNVKGGKPRAARPAKKTAAELDSEMADYFSEQQGAGEAGAVNGGGGAAAAVGGADAPMEEAL